MKKALYLLISITLIYMVSYYYRQLELRAVCKKLSNWTLFVNTNNCGFCLKQIEFLGSNSKYMNIVHCDDDKNIRDCSNIQELPQWKRGSKSLPGARLSNYSLRELIKI